MSFMLMETFFFFPANHHPNSKSLKGKWQRVWIVAVSLVHQLQTLSSSLGRESMMMQKVTFFVFLWRRKQVQVIHLVVHHWYHLKKNVTSFSLFIWENIFMLDCGAKRVKDHLIQK